jgi:phenylacetate-coenzyme A ligase PaaK-like adenylate-forming protein
MKRRRLKSEVFGASPSRSTFACPFHTPTLLVEEVEVSSGSTGNRGVFLGSWALSQL